MGQETNNKAKEVKGPEIKQEDWKLKEMKSDSGALKSGYHGTSVGLSELSGGGEKPLSSLGSQEHKVMAGSLGGGSRNPKGMGRSVAKKAEYKEKKQLKEESDEY